MRKTAIALILFSSLLFSILAGIGLVNLTMANPSSGGMTPALNMPSITIGSDGRIDPENAPITKTENVYVLTGNIINHIIEIRCNDVKVNGAGFMIREDPFPAIYAPSSGITIYSNGVTVENVNIEHHDNAITIYGSHNVVRKINFGSSLKIDGNYNEITGNVFNHAYLIVEGNHNTIKGNILRGRGIVMGGNFNTATENTVEQCRDFAVKPSNGTNFFYLNNFLNNTDILTSLNNPSNQEVFAKLDLAKLAQTHIAPLQWQMIPNGWKAVYPDNTVFDNGTVGNYWSDYSGTDANHDGIGDTPYLIGGNLQDRYPLLSPFNSTSIPLEMHKPSPTQLSSSPAPSQEPTSSPETQKSNPAPTDLIISVSALSVAGFGATLLVYLKKRYKSKTNSHK